MVRTKCPVMDKDDGSIFVEIRNMHDEYTMTMIMNYIYLFGEKTLAYAKICSKNVQLYYGNPPTAVIFRNVSIASLVDFMERETEQVGA